MSSRDRQLIVYFPPVRNACPLNGRHEYSGFVSHVPGANLTLRVKPVGFQGIAESGIAGIQVAAAIKRNRERKREQFATGRHNVIMDRLTRGRGIIAPSSLPQAWPDNSPSVAMSDAGYCDPRAAPPPCRKPFPAHQARGARHVPVALSSASLGDQCAFPAFTPLPFRPCSARLSGVSRTAPGRSSGGNTARRWPLWCRCFRRATGNRCTSLQIHG